MTIKSILSALAILLWIADAGVAETLLVKDAKTGEVIAELELGAKQPVKIGEVEVVIESKAPTRLEVKAKAITIPIVDLQGTSLEEAVDFYRIRAAELDTVDLEIAKKGVNIRIASAAVGGLVIHELKLREVSLYDILLATAQQTGTSVEFGESSILFKPAAK